ncbi:hypothetical protein LEP1GSC133_5237, partial [Leptospira borgpetersenii serovar Pomona str. 200901868]
LVFSDWVDSYDVIRPVWENTKEFPFRLQIGKASLFCNVLFLISFNFLLDLNPNPFLYIDIL